MSPRYLEFRAERSFGLSNARMALEIGVGLAHLSGRTLIFYDHRPIWRGSHPAVGGHNRSPEGSVLDLFEATSVPTRPDTRMAEIEAGQTVRELDWPDLYHCAFRHPAAIDDARFKAFLNGRPRAVAFTEEDEAAPILRFAKRSLALYSHFFYLPENLRSGLKEAIRKVRPRPPYRRMADDVARHFGAFNAIHVRRGDFMTKYYKHVTITPEAVLANIEATMPKDETLLICTDAPKDLDFFEPILKAYPKARMLETFVLEDPVWRERLRALPCNGDAALALVSQLVAAQARVFAGSLYSTFTAMIHRERGLNAGDDPFLFVFNPLQDRAPFRDGAYVERAEGAFSWNRFPFDCPAEMYAWFREWPESFR